LLLLKKSVHIEIQSTDLNMLARTTAMEPK
jgi:hypothetical protein